MNCVGVRELLGAYLDGELSSDQHESVERHLAGCVECTAVLEQLQRAGAMVRAQLPPMVAPDLLRSRVRASLRPSRGTWWMRQVAAGLAIAVASSAVTLTAVHHSLNASQGSAHEVVVSHVRALMTNHLTDVISTDQHTVKPWFNGKVDFSPEVQRLDSAGFPLIGGRVDSIGRRVVAGLVYGRRKHVISVYTWPAAPGAAADADPSTIAGERGYNVVRWRHDGLVFWAVSDLNTEELGQFVRAFVEGGAVRR